MESDRAVEWLDTANRLRRKGRAASQRAWFPLVLFGLIILGSLPLYGGAARVGPAILIIPMSSVGGFVANPRQLSLYWFLATVGGYIATVVYFRWRDARTGVGSRAWPFVAAGIGLFGLLVLSSPRGLGLLGLPESWSPWFHVGDADIFAKGLAPILTIALGVTVLAAIERSRSLIVFAATFLGIALLVSLDDFDSVTARMGLGEHGTQTNVLLAGTVLLIGGLAFGIAGRRAR